MRFKGVRFWMFVAATFGGGAAPLSVFAASDSEAAAVVQSITACRAIERQAERFACYDRVASSIGKGEAAVRQAAAPPTVESQREEARREFGKSPAPAENSRVAARAAAKPAAAPQASDTGVKRIVAKLEHISRMSDGRLLIVTTSDGAWLQTDHEPFQNLPRAGDEIVLRQGRLGNYLCDLDRWHSVRCRRVD